MTTVQPLVIFLDTNVWDFLFARDLDLAFELPAPNFKLLLTRENALEIEPIKNPEKLAFIRRSISCANIETDWIFGFDDKDTLECHRRYGGFDEGRWQTQQESQYIAATPIGESLRPTGLKKHEGDRALAARSFQHVVLTKDRQDHLKRAAAKGAFIVILDDFDESDLSLADFIRSRLPPHLDEEKH